MLKVFLTIVWCSMGLVVWGQTTEQEIIKTIMDSNAYTLEHLKGMGDEISKHGSLEFWSSGGLIHQVENDPEGASWDQFSLVPKHIQVITLVEGQAAVAMYYSEGSMTPKGGTHVSHYLTRVTEVFVKEDGKWKTRAAHYSPVMGGSGTSQTSTN